jgi:hypothetical protein
MPNPNTCSVTGYIESLLGICPVDIVIKVSPIVPYFNGSWTIPVTTTSFYPTLNGASGGTPPVSGYFDMDLGETETSGASLQFKATYTDEGIYKEIFFLPVIIPNIASIELSELLTIRTS